jgi:pimeloyl-ACP methyl ester carboxylesterase
MKKSPPILNHSAWLSDHQLCYGASVSSCPDAALERTGTGELLVLVHGSATDRATWAIQMATLSSRLELISYDRRGTANWPAALDELTTEEHADDLADLIREHATPPTWLCGSSYGAVVVLDACRRYPELISGAILCEPPLPPSDAELAVPREFIDEYESRKSSQGGEAAAEFFLRTVLTDEAYERIPVAFQRRSKQMWRQIDSDIRALSRYQPRYDQLSSVATPILLLRGGKSAPFYRSTLETLAQMLGNASLHTLESAGHMMHAEAPRAFNREVVEFVLATSKS